MYVTVTVYVQTFPRDFYSTVPVKPIHGTGGPHPHVPVGGRRGESEAVEVWLRRGHCCSRRRLKSRREWLRRRQRQRRKGEGRRTRTVPTPLLLLLLMMMMVLIMNRLRMRRRWRWMRNRLGGEPLSPPGGSIGDWDHGAAQRVEVGRGSLHPPRLPAISYPSL